MKLLAVLPFHCHVSLFKLHKNIAKTWRLFSNNVNITITKCSLRDLLRMVTLLDFVGKTRNCVRTCDGWPNGSVRKSARRFKQVAKSRTFHAYSVLGMNIWSEFFFRAIKKIMLESLTSAVNKSTNNNNNKNKTTTLQLIWRPVHLFLTTPFWN